MGAFRLTQVMRRAGRQGGKWAAASAECLGCVLALLANPAWGAFTERVSVSSTGAQASGGDSSSHSVSADGRFVAFQSSGSNLVANDTNGLPDAFVRDRMTGTTERVSVSTSGQQGNGGSGNCDLTPDGRFVSFNSAATNLVTGDTNGVEDVFVRDRLNGTTERISVSSAGQQAAGGQGSANSRISADGRLVAFVSDATNLVPGDTNDRDDIFVRDRQAGETERVSVDSSGAQGDDRSNFPSISADGWFVAFQSYATNLVPGDTNGVPDAFVHDRQAGTTERVSLSSANEQGDGDSIPWSISHNGRFVAFDSDATNLVPESTVAGMDVFVRDRQTGTTECVSVSSDGALANQPSYGAEVTPDGRFVAFHSWATNLVASDAPRSWPDVFLRDRQTTTTERVSVSTSGEKGNATSKGARMTPDGRFVVFYSWADNLVPGDTNGYRDGFIRDRYGDPDSTPPDTFITSGPCDQTISSTGVMICWSGSDDQIPAQYLQYSSRLDSGAWSAYSSDTCAVLNSLSAGLHTLEVMAKDTAGNADPTPAQCQFTVDLSAPHVSVDSPIHGSKVKGTVSISASASDPGGIQKVEFYAAGQLVSTDTTAPYSCSWDTTQPSVAEGYAQICAEAYANGGKTAWHCILVTVDNCTFDDVPKTVSAWPYIEAIVREEITNGCQADPPLYCPSASVTRAQMAKFLCIAAGKSALNSATPTFADVPKSSWAYGYVERLADAASWGGTAPTGGCRIVGGIKYYCPNDPVTREQMAKFLCVATGKSAMPSCLGTFADVSSFNMFCTWIERLADPASWGGSAVTSGCAVGPPKLYCPKANITRGQMAVFLVRAFALPL